MTPMSLLSSLLRERGVTDALTWPVQVQFDEAYTVEFTEPLPGFLAAECVLDSAVPGSDPRLQSLLLAWNRRPAITATGAFALGSDGESIVYRTLTPAGQLDLAQFKELLHAFLVHAARLDAALMAHPLEIEEDFPDSIAAAAPEPSAMIRI